MLFEFNLNLTNHCCKLIHFFPRDKYLKITTFIRMEYEITRFDKENELDFPRFDSLFDQITPFEGEEKNVVTLSDYILRNNLATGETYSYINAAQVVVKAISDKVTRYNLNEIGTTSNVISDNLDLETKRAYKKSFVKKLEDMFINVVGDCGLARFMISKHSEDIIEINARSLGDYMICFNILEGHRNLQDHLPVGSVFGLYKINQGTELDINEVIGNTLVTAGYALYGTCTMIVLAFNDYQGVHIFYLDQSLGEFILREPYTTISKRGISYSVNEGLTVGWDEATKIFVNRKKDPRLTTKRECYFIGSLTADVTRLLRAGGIYMNPANVKHPQGKLGLLYEANPMAYILRQAGGYAADGYMPIMDVQPKGPHHKTPFFGGSIEDVINLMELKTIYKARDLGGSRK